ncbi:MAG: SLATT domain-containing protein [Alphaproteobacteria bacterium]|nr:MAG: SLATT domain-containing protein [Alphaproteobacteria bacterium]
MALGDTLETALPIWRVHPLLGTMWKTKNSRFHAADRLRSRGWWKGIALSVLSAYILVLSVVPKFVESIGGNTNADYIGLVAIAASVFILVFSITSIFDEDKLRSSYMHDNAKEIASLYHAYKLEIDGAIKAGSTFPSPEITNSKYQSIIEKCPFNHDAIDWLKTSIDIALEENKPVKTKQAQLFFWMFYDIYFWPAFAVIAALVPSYLLLTL